MTTLIPRTRLVLVTAAVAVIASLAPSPAAAQGQARGHHVNRSQVEAIIRRAETASDTFRRKMDGSLDKSLLNGTRREDSINEQVKELEASLDKLRRKFDKTDTWRQTREEVQDVLVQARDVNRIMEDARFKRVLETEWRALRHEINTLAGVYDLAPLGN